MLKFATRNLPNTALQNMAKCYIPEAENNTAWLQISLPNSRNPGRGRAC